MNSILETRLLRSATSESAVSAVSVARTFRSWISSVKIWTWLEKFVVVESRRWSRTTFCRNNSLISVRALVFSSKSEHISRWCSLSRFWISMRAVGDGVGLSASQPVFQYWILRCSFVGSARWKYRFEHQSSNRGSHGYAHIKIQRFSPLRQKGTQWRNWLYAACILVCAQREYTEDSIYSPFGDWVCTEILLDCVGYAVNWFNSQPRILYGFCDRVNEFTKWSWRTMF